MTRPWTGGCAGVSIDPQWQVASEPVAWRQCLGRLDREGQLHLRQTRDRPDPVPRWRDWGEVGDCNVSWNYFLTRKGFLQRFAFIMCAFICQQAHNRHWANGQDFFARRKDRQRADAGFQWKKVLSEAKNSPSESLEYLCPNPHSKPPLVSQKECKTIEDLLNKSNICHISMHFLFYIAFLIFASIQMIWHCNNVFPAQLLLILLPFPQN